MPAGAVEQEIRRIHLSFRQFLFVKKWVMFVAEHSGRIGAKHSHAAETRICGWAAIPCRLIVRRFSADPALGSTKQ